MYAPARDVVAAALVRAVAVATVAMLLGCASPSADPAHEQGGTARPDASARPDTAAVIANGAVRLERTEPAMGTTVRVILHATDDATGRAALQAAFARVHALDALLSDWSPDSEVSRLSARSSDGPSGPVAVSEELWAVLAHAQALHTRSAGAFDVTVGPLVTLWRRAARRLERPDPDRLSIAREAVSGARRRLDPSRRQVTLGAPGMRIDLGGVAKGYILDEAMATLHAHGVTRALVDGGGDIVTGDPPPGRRAWHVAIGDPSTGLPTALVLSLRRQAVATSGDAYRGVTIDGVRYSHLVDPRTGEALSPPVGATVVAPTGMAADALASAACVLGPDRGAALLRETPDVEGRLVLTPDDKDAVVVDTPGLDALRRTPDERHPGR